MSRLTIHRIGLALLVVAVLVFCVPDAVAKKNKLPKVSHDGLELQKDTKLAAVYMKPGAEFSQYKRVAILDCFVSFQKGWQRDYNRDVMGLEGRISDEDVVEIKKRVADLFMKVFKRELEKKGSYTIVDKAAEDVLVLRPSIINLNVTSPDTMTPGSRSFAASAGAMTLYLEFFDSVSSDLLGRVIDAQAAPDTGGYLANRATNTAEGDRILSRWAGILRDHLDSIHGSK